MKRYFCLLLVTAVFLVMFCSAFLTCPSVGAEEECVWGDWITDIEPSCEKPGYRHRVCLLDPGYPHEEREIIPPLGHEYDVTEKLPSCTNRGTRTYKCKRCGDTYTEDFGTLSEHKYVSADTKTPTCVSDGEMTYTCTECGLKYVEKIVKTGHKYKEYTVKVPTCTARGTKKYVCTRCKDTYTKEYGSIQPHLFREEVSEENGKRIVSEVCADCGYSQIIKITEIPAVTPKKEPVHKEENKEVLIACAAAGTIDTVMLIGFTVSVLSDMSVLRWYKNKKKQINAFNKGTGDG